MTEQSKINKTGTNFLIALSAAVLVTAVLTAIYTLMAAMIAGSDGTFNSISVIEWAGAKFFSLFKMIGICALPVAFLITFALLQRFRIKI